MQPNGGLYTLSDGRQVHGNGRPVETNPQPGQSTMSEQQYRDLCSFVEELQWREDRDTLISS